MILTCIDDKMNKVTIDEDHGNENSAILIWCMRMGPKYVDNSDDVEERDYMMMTRS